MGKVEVVVSRGEALDDAFDRVRAAFEAAGQQVHVPSDPLGTSDFARYFHAASGSQAGSTVVAVATGPWTDARAIEFLNTHLSALEPDSEVDWVFASAWPLHPLVDYIFGMGSAGRLEAAALCETGDRRLAAASAPACARLCVDLVRQYTGVVVDLDDLRAVQALDELVSKTLRPCEDPDLALTAGTYRPGAILELLGAAFGEIIRRRHEHRMKWAVAPDVVGGSFPVLEVDGGDDVTCLLPVDRVFRCYQEGRDRSLVRYFDVVVDDVMDGVGATDDTLDWESLAPQLLPVLKPAGWSMSMGVARRPFLADGPVNAPLVVLAVDHPTRISFVLEGRLDELGLGEEEVFARAMKNLEALNNDLAVALTPLEVDDGMSILRLDCDDYFNASRALLGASLHAAAAAHLPARPHYLLGVPNRDILLIAAPDDREQFYAFQSLVRWFHERQPAPISSLCFELGPDGVTDHCDTEGDAV